MSNSLSVSTIAFPGGSLDEPLDLLRGLGVHAIELAPYNAFGEWDMSDDDLRTFRARLSDAGFDCPAMQGIVYNAGDVHLFASPQQRENLFTHLARVARIAGLLGVRACVFGAPRLRDPGDLPADQARAIAVEFLRRLGPIFADQGASLAFEANARHYACRFVVTTAEAVDLVAEVGTPGIGLQIDTGTLFLEGEDPGVLARAAPFAVHAHISEPDLAPTGTSGVDHGPMAAALNTSGYSGTVSIEMKLVPHWREAVPAAVSTARAAYFS